MDASAAAAAGTGTGNGNGGECHVCGDAIERDSQGRFFVACHHCGFPVCRPCYDFECKDGSHCCPHCNTRYPDPQDRDEDDFHDHRNYDYDHRADDPANASVQGGPPSQQQQQLALSLPPDPADHEIESASVHRLARSCASVSGMAVGMADTMSNSAWKERVESWKAKHPNEKPGIPELDDLELDDIMMAEAEARQPLWRKVPIPSSKMNPYRIVIVLRLIILGFFFNYRLTNPPTDAIGLWLVSIICEIWFALSWILDQFPKWSPVTRETYLDTLSMRYEREGEPCKLGGIDVFVSTVDPLKEPPLITANTVLSVVAMDYPVDRVACYVSDDGASMLTFDTMNETSEFARKWVPFCKKYAIEPRAPEFYFSQKIDYLKDKVHPTFVKDRRAMKREYEEFKVKINGMVSKAQKKPEEGWVMQDGTPWPGNNTRDHPGMIQVFLGNGGARDTEGNELPRVVYVSREKRPGHQHHKKAGAMNALIRVSAVLTNAAFMLNLDCDHYINNSKAVREAMCFLMDPQLGKKLCYVQFPQRFDGIDPNDRYANRNTVFFDINMKGLDGLQGPVYVGTGCVFNRQALYGYEPAVTQKRPKLTCDCWPSWCCCCCCGGSRKKGGSKKSKGRSLASRLLGRKKKSKAPDVAAIPLFKLEEIEEGLEGYEEHDKSWLMSQKNFEKRFGLSPVFIASTLMENGGLPESASSVSLIKEAIHVISCGYEEKTEWGKEVGWIYGSVTEDILTGFKMHCRGWKSVYCMPALAAFKGSAPINLSDRLHQVLRWALGSIEIFMSRHCPLWYAWGSGSSTNTENSNRSKLKLLQRMAYINTVVYPFTSIPLVAYCTLPAVCLLTGKFITPTLTGIASIWFLSMFLAIISTSVLELRWSGVSLSEFWRNEQFWVIAGVSAHLFAVVQGLLKVLGGVDTNFTVTAKAAADEEDEFADLYLFKWTTLLIPPTTLVIINLVALVAGVSAAINNNYQSWGPLFGKVFFAVWVVLHLYPFLKGLMGRHNRTPTVVVMWSVLLASIFSLLWLRLDPFLPKNTGPVLQQCGIDC